MNQKLLQVLGSLRATFTSPAVAQVQDPGLKAHLAKAEMLASFLYVELTAMPEVKQRTLREYAQLSDDIAALLAANGKSPNAARTLAGIAAAEDTQHFEQALSAAKQVQLQLHEIDPAGAGPLLKKLLAIEHRYSERSQAVLQADLLPSEDKANTANEVSFTRSYDREKLGRFIAQSFPEEPAVRVAESDFISGGNSKYTMAIRLSGVKSLPEWIILRGDAESSVQFGGADTAYEYRLLKIVYEQGVCVARPLALEPTGEVFGTPFLLAELRPGKALGHTFMLPPPNKAIGADMAANLARIHAVPITQLGWLRGANTSNSEQTRATLERSHGNWNALDIPSPVFETAFHWLRENVGVMDGSRTLVHGDYNLGNILVDNDKVSAVLDWEFGQIGNPAYDLGYFYYMAEALCSWDEFLAAYQAAGGKLPGKAELDYCILWGAVWVGVAVCQAMAAYHSGAAPGLQAAVVVSRRFHDVSAMRVGKLLERIL